MAITTSLTRILDVESQILCRARLFIVESECTVCERVREGVQEAACESTYLGRSSVVHWRRRRNAVHTRMSRGNYSFRSSVVLQGRQYKNGKGSVLRDEKMHPRSLATGRFATLCLARENGGLAG